MAAPSYKNSIKWGSILTVDSTHKGKIGLYITVSNTDTVSTVKTEIWFHSMYWVKDTSNTLKANWNATTATTSQGSVSINNLVEGVTDSGSGWADDGMILIKTMTNSYNRGTNASTKNFAASLSDITNLAGTMSVTTSFTIPALATSQNVYICLDTGTVYAREYFTSSSMYIDNTGAIYAPAFMTGNSLYISSSGITAKAFKKGIP